VALNLGKLMSYKDEYEVARLYSDPAFLKRLEAEFEDGYKLRLNLAPPILGRRNARGEPVKSEFGPWMFRVLRWLARMRKLRGTALDPFGRTEERRMERRLIADYREMIEGVLGDLSPATLPLAVDLAGLPDQVRGFGHVKRRSVEEMEARKAELLAGGPGIARAA
jgi:indolepyruvate ferredoxin oxidoreductase